MVTKFKKKLLINLVKILIIFIISCAMIFLIQEYIHHKIVLPYNYDSVIK